MKLKRVVSFIIAAAILLGMTPAISLPASASEMLYFKTSPQLGTATLYKVDTSISGNVEVPAFVQGYPVTQIGAGAFSYCSKVTSITIPDSVTEIGVGAFRGCSKLSSITLPFVGSTAEQDPSTFHSFGSVFGTSTYTSAVATKQHVEGLDVSNFGYNSASTTYYIPSTLSNVTITGGYIPQYSFQNCSKLTKVVLGDRVTKIEQHAFSACSGLTGVTIGNGVTELGYSAFYNCSSLSEITVPESINTIGDKAFYGCSGLKSMTLPFVGESRTASGYKAVFGYIFGYTYSKYATNGTLQCYGSDGAYYYHIPSVQTVTVTDMASIPYNAFRNCKNLKAVNLPDKLTKISGYAFSGCNTLGNITIPESVTEIGESAFSYCKAFTSITVPEGVSVLYMDTFDSCTMLGEIYLPDDCMIEPEVFEGTKYYTDASYWEDDVLYIDNHLIKANSSISGHYTVKEGTQTIAAKAFEACRSLEGIIFSDSCKNIGYLAFLDCESLTEIELPDSIRKISYQAFKNSGYYNDPENWEDDALYIGKCLVAVQDNKSGSCSIKPGTLAIAHETFLWAVDITALTIPESVVCIGPDQTFWGEIDAVYYEGNAEQWSQIEFWWYEDANPMKNAAKTYFNNEQLKTAYFSSVPKIGANTFCYNQNLETIIIGHNVQKIGSMAFAGCNNLNNVYYLGTQSDWEAMEIAEDSGLEDKEIHFVGKHNFAVADAEANCENGAGREFICKDCGYGFRVEVSDPLGHTHQKAEIVDPTCTEQGYTVYRCHCGNSYNTSFTETLGHDYKPGERILSTETDFGYTTYVCSRCADSYQADWTAPVDGITGTCGEDAVWAFDEGTGVLTIRGRGAVQSYSAGSAPWDSYSDGIYAVAIGAGITAIGGNAFAACGKIVEIKNDSALQITAGSAEYGSIGKNAKNIYASGAGESHLTYLDGFVFITQGDMGYCVDYTGSNTILRLPEEYTAYNGTTVTSYELMDYALAYNPDLLIVYAPNSVRKIGQYTFAGSNFIADLYIYNYDCALPDSGETIAKEITIHGYEGSSAEIYAEKYGNPFVSVTKDYPTGQCGQNAVWTLNLDTGALRITGSGSIYDYEQGLAPWYAYKEEIKSIYIASGIRTVGNYGFYGLDKVEYLDLGYSIQEIGVGAFMDCSSLSAVAFPETLTSMGYSAFANCSALSAVVIPDRLSEIGSGVFYNCSALQSVTIGSSVSIIQENAFADCTSLSVIKMRGAPPVISGQVFGPVSGKYVYYYSTVSGWKDAVSNGVWNGYTAIPYNAITETGFNGTNVFAVKVVDRYNEAIKNATVTFGTVTKSTDDDGIAYFVLAAAAQRLEISASGFSTFTDESYLSDTGHFMEIISLSDSPSTVAGVSCNGKSIATSIAQINCNSDANVRISVSGYCPRTILRYELLQGNRVIATTATATKNATFNVSAKNFEEGETVQVRMYISDGSYVASALNIQVLNIADFSEEAFLSGLENVNISLPVVGNIPFAFTISNPALTDVVVDGDTIKIGVNIDLTEDTDITNIQKQISNAKKAAANRVANAKAGFVGEISGYLEIKYIGNNQYVINKSQVSLVVGTSFGASAQASYFGIVGVYFKVGLTSTGELALSFSGYDVDEGFQFEELDLTIDHTLRVEGGGYLLWGAGKAGFYGQGSMGFGLEIAPDFGVENVYIKGEVGVSWSVLWGWIRGSKVIWDGTLYEYDAESTRSMRALINDKLRSALQDPENYLLNDRGYLDDRSGWYGSSAKAFRTGSDQTSGTIQSNIYYNVEPKLVACGDTIMMLWLDDNSQRDINNYQTLYYSVYNTETKMWTVPTQLDSNNTFDCEFDVCSDGENIYVIYTEKTHSTGNVEDLDIADNAQIAQVIEDVEIRIYAYNGTGFEESVALTDNDVCETLPGIRVVDGILTATWSTLEPIGISGVSQRNNAVYSAQRVNNDWSAPSILVRDTQQVYAVSSGILDGKKYTAYIVDTDGNGDTVDDFALLLVDESGDLTQVASGAIKSAQFVCVNGADLLMWNDESNIYYVASCNGTSHKLLFRDTVISGRFVCTTVENGLSFVSFVSATEGEEGTDLFGIYFDGTQAIGSAIRLTDTAGFVDSYGIEYAQDCFLISYVESTAVIDGEEMATTADFRYAVVPCRCDVSIVDVDYDIGQVEPGKTFSAMVYLKNSGLKPITHISVCLNNSSHKVVSSQECAVQILPGTSAEIPVILTTPEQINAEQFYLTALLPGENGKQNTYPIAIGFADLRIQAEQKIIGGKNYILYSVSNGGNMDAAANITICENDAAGTGIASIHDIFVPVGTSAQYMFDAAGIQEDTLIFAKVSADAFEPNMLDNTVSVNLLHIDTGVYEYTESDVVVNPILSATGATYDKYTDETVSVTVESGLEQFSGIQDLTAGVDYSVKDSEIIISKDYLQSLPIGVTTLTFRFAYSQDAVITRSLNINVCDSAPIPVSGTLAIDGVSCVGSIVSANTSGLTPFGAAYDYQWNVNGVAVGNESTYAIRTEDYGKTITLTVTAKNGYTGSFTCSSVVDYQTQNAPVAPVAVAVNDTSVQLLKLEGIEYSMDLKKWQSSNLFDGLLPNTQYTFYARLKATAISHASAASSGMKVTTCKSTPEKPTAPVVELRSDTTVTLQWHEGYEYSMDGVTWQNIQNAEWYGHNRFVGLSPNTEYTFYQRVAETQTSYASSVSDALVIRTWKSTVGAPAKPVVETILPDSIILEANENYQYKLVIDAGIHQTYEPVTGNTWGTAEEPAVETAGWQDSNVFTGLLPNTRYICYQRYKGTDVAYAGRASEPIYVTTVKYMPEKAVSPVLASVSDTIIVLSSSDDCEYSIDGVNWQDSAVFADLQPDTEYTLYQRTKETDTHYASPMSDGLVIRTDRKPVVIALMDGEEIEYLSLMDAITDAPARTTLRLLADVTETIVIRQDLFLDLNGFDLTGDITVRTGVALSVLDSQTDDFTVRDSNGYGKIIGEANGVKAQRGYLMITEEDGVSFHRIDLNIHTMSLRPTDAGVYYQSNFAGDEVVARNIVCYGVAFSVKGIATEEDMGICSWYDNFTAGSGGNAANGTLLHGIMKTSNSDAENAENAAMPIYGRAYLQTKDGQYVLGNMVSRCLREQVELIDDQWNTLTPEQQTAVLTMYETYKKTMKLWDIPNILSAAK